MRQSVQTWYDLLRFKDFSIQNQLDKFMSTTTYAMLINLRTFLRYSKILNTNLDRNGSSNVLACERGIQRPSCSGNKLEDTGFLSPFSVRIFAIDIHRLTVKQSH